jgi:hypothetical protein
MTITDIQPRRALYYPRAHFTSTKWLKSALLYWESLVRIVPDGSALQDPPEVHELAAVGLIENVSPAPFRRAAKRLFLRHVAGAFRRPGALPFRDERDPAASRRSYKLFPVGEIERDLLRELRAHGLAAVTEDWVTMPSEMADVYRIGLAAEIARDLHVALAADPPFLEVASTFLAHQRVMGERIEETPIDGYACARTMTPFRLLETSHLPTDKLLRARQKYADERLAFRELVQSRAVPIAALPSVVAIDSHVRDLAVEFESEANVLRRSRTESRLREATEIVGVGAPATIGAGLTLSGVSAVAAALGGVGSLAAGVTDWVVRRNQTLHGAHYLLSLEALANSVRAAGSMRFGVPLDVRPRR